MFQKIKKIGGMAKEFTQQILADDEEEECQSGETKDTDEASKSSNKTKEEYKIGETNTELMEALSVNKEGSNSPTQKNKSGLVVNHPLIPQVVPNIPNNNNQQNKKGGSPKPPRSGSKGKKEAENLLDNSLQEKTLGKGIGKNNKRVGELHNELKLAEGRNIEYQKLLRESEEIKTKLLRAEEERGIENIKLKEDNSSLENTIKDLRETLEVEKTNSGVLHGRLNVYENKNQLLKEKITELQNNFTEMCKSIKTQNESEINTIKQQLIEKNQEIANLNSNIFIAQTQKPPKFDLSTILTSFKDILKEAEALSLQNFKLEKDFSPHDFMSFEMVNYHPPKSIGKEEDKEKHTENIEGKEDVGDNKEEEDEILLEDPREEIKKQSMSTQITSPSPELDRKQIYSFIEEKICNIMNELQKTWESKTITVYKSLNEKLVERLKERESAFSQQDAELRSLHLKEQEEANQRYERNENIIKGLNAQLEVLGLSYQQNNEQVFMLEEELSMSLGKMQSLREKVSERDIKIRDLDIEVGEMESERAELREMVRQKVELIGKKEKEIKTNQDLMAKEIEGLNAQLDSAYKLFIEVYEEVRRTLKSIYPLEDMKLEDISSEQVKRVISQGIEESMLQSISSKSRMIIEHWESRTTKFMSQTSEKLNNLSTQFGRTIINYKMECEKMHKQLMETLPLGGSVNKGMNNCIIDLLTNLHVLSTHISFLEEEGEKTSSARYNFDEFKNKMRKTIEENQKIEKEKIDLLETELGKAQRECKLLLAKQKISQDKMTSLEDTLRQLEKQCFNAKDQHSKAQEMLQEIMREKESIREKMEHFEEKYEISKLKCKTLKNRIVEMSNTNYELKGVIENSRIENNKLKHKLKLIDEYEENIEKLKHQIRIKNEELDVNKKAMENLQTAIETLESKQEWMLKGKDLEVINLQTQKEELKHNIENLKNEKEESDKLHYEINKLSECLEIEKRRTQESALEVEEMRKYADELRNTVTNQSKDKQNLVDRRVVNKFIVNFVDESKPKNIRKDMLSSLSGILNFSEEDKKQLGLFTADNNNISQQFYDFMLEDD